MAFEVFTETGAKNTNFISVTANKTFGFPRAFIENNTIEDNSKVVILYDEQEKKIALYFSQKNPKFGYAFRRSKNKKHGGTVIAHGFFDKKNIDTTKYAQRYSYEVVPMRELGHPDIEGNAFVISLELNEDAKKLEGRKRQEEVEDMSITIDDIPF